MQIIIAEKPSMAKEIAKALGSPSLKDGYIVCAEGTIVTWCVGHLIEALIPDDVNPIYKEWSYALLPILQESLKVAPAKRTKKQFDIIKNLLSQNQSATVVHACDADREGQLIGDELLTFCGWKWPVKRLWLDALTPEAINSGFLAIKNNTEYKGLFHAGLSRQFADWELGINLSRFFSIRAREADPQSPPISCGRVQTPTLALIVNRDLERENFKPKDYIVPVGMFQVASGVFQATWKAPEDCPALDVEKRLVDADFAKKLLEEASSQSGKIVSMVQEEKKKAHPLPFDLPTLQKEANSKLGFTAAKTLEVAQKLYEQKVTTYPRTECQYLPEEMHRSAPSIFAALGKIPGIPQVEDADPSIKSAAWNSQKVIAHNGIIPTGSLPEQDLSADETALLGVIVERFLIQFYPCHRYHSTIIAFKIGAQTWGASGLKIIDMGWRKRNTDEDEEGQEKTLPPMQEGEKVACQSLKLENRKTTAPAQFNDGSLTEAMAQVHKFVSDPAIKAKLKENSGIGTPATRASFIEELLKRRYIVRSGKSLLSTPLGRKVISLVPKTISDPGYTALMEDKLKDIADNKLSKDVFHSETREFISNLIAELKKDSSLQFEAVAIYPCPECQSPLGRYNKKTGKGVYWACFSEKHKSGKPVFLDDKKGKPTPPPEKPKTGTAPTCQYCEQSMELVFLKNQNKHVWACFGKDNSKHPENPQDPQKRKAAFQDVKE